MGILHDSDKQKALSSWYEHVRVLLADPDWPMILRFIVDLQSVTDKSSLGDEATDQVKTVFTSYQPALSGKISTIIASREFRRASRFAELVERFGTSTPVFNHLDTACLFFDMPFPGIRQARQILQG